MHLEKLEILKNYQELMKSCDIGLSSVIAEKSLFNEEVLFVNLNTKEDFVLWLSILKKYLDFWFRSRLTLLEKKQKFFIKFNYSKVD